MSERAEPRLPVPFLVLTTVVCGALVMVVEVLGSRVVGPFFGASLFVWTSLISVTLLSLAAGYAIGGRLADRSSGSPDRLYLLVGAAGLATLAIPLVRGPVLRASVPLGVRGGAFLSSFLLFAPALTLLGMVSPFVVRIAVREVERVGRVVGLFSALSTAGSLAGTVAAGFFLIPTFGVSRILAGTGWALVALALGWFALVRRRLLLLLLLLPAPLSFRPAPLASVVQSNGTRATVLERRDSAYAELKVVEYRFGETRLREMLIDGLIQGGVDPDSGLSGYEYPEFMTRLARSRRPEGRTAIVVGLGAGAIPASLERAGVRCDVVEIDPAVADLARRWFGFRISGELILGDARAALARLDRRYDYVFLDVFGGDTTPGHVLSLEALRLARQRLAPGGVLAANLISQVGTDGFVAASVERTLRRVFDVVELHPVFDPAAEDFGNVVVVAFDGPPRPPDPVALAGGPLHEATRAAVEARIGAAPYRFPPGTPSIEITDDWNPLDFHDRATRERLRAAILAATEPEVLM